MKTVEIKSITNVSVYIEDLGIRLNGINAVAYVSELDASRSKSLKDLSKLVKVSVKRTLNIWPFSKPLHITSHTPLVNTVSAEKISSNELLESFDKNLSTHHINDDRMEKLIENVNKLVDVMQEFAKNSANTVGHRDSPNLTGTGSHLASRSNVSRKSDDPIFIPSKIIPDNSTIRLNSLDQSQDRPDIDDAAKNLKKLRGKK